MGKHRKVWIQVVVPVVIFVALQSNAAFASTSSAPPYNGGSYNCNGTCSTVDYTQNYGSSTTDPTGLSTASNSQSVNEGTGVVSVAASVTSNAPADVGYWPYGSADTVDSPQANANALAAQVNTVSSAGSVSASFSFASLSVSGSGQGAPLNPLSGGAYIQDYLEWYHYPCTYAGQCYVDSTGYAYNYVAGIYPSGTTYGRNSSGTTYPNDTSDTLTAGGVPSGGVVVVRAGLVAYANSPGGQSSFTANSSATVQGVATP